MTATPSWSVMLGPIGRLLLRKQGISIWGFLLVVITQIPMLLRGGSDSIIPLYMCLTFFLLGLGFIFHALFVIAGSNIWDTLPNARARMSGLMFWCTACIGTPLVFLYSTTLGSSFYSKAPGYMIWSIVLSTPAMVWLFAALAAPEIGASLRIKNASALLNIASLAALTAAIFLLATGHHAAAFRLACVTVFAFLALALWGTWLLRLSRLRGPVSLSPLLIGIFGPPHQAPADRTGNWMQRLNIESDIARAQRNGERLWLINRITPQQIIGRIATTGVLLIFSLSPLLVFDIQVRPLAFIVALQLIFFSSIFSLFHGLNQPWLFVASLPVSRRELADNLTVKAAWTMAFDALAGLSIAGISLWQLASGTALRKVTDFTNGKMTVTYSPDAPLPPSFTWLNMFTGTAIFICAMAILRPLTLMNVGNGLMPPPRKTITAALRYLIIVGLCFGLVYNINRIELPPIAQIPLLLTMVLAICFASFRLYNALWLTARLDGQGDIFSFRKALRQAFSRQ